MLKKDELWTLQNTTVAIDQLLCLTDDLMEGVEVIPLFVYDSLGASKRSVGDALTYPAKTSCLNDADYEEILNLNIKDNFIYVAFNEKWSKTTFEAYDRAAREYGRGGAIRVDTKGCSVMAIPLVQEIKKLLTRGTTPDVILSETEKIANNIVGHFIPDSTRELKAGGRIAKIIPLISLGNNELVIKKGKVLPSRLKNIPGDAFISTLDGGLGTIKAPIGVNIHLGSGVAWIEDKNYVEH